MFSCFPAVRSGPRREDFQRRAAAGVWSESCRHVTPLPRLQKILKMCLNTRDNSDIHVFLGFEKKMSGEKQKFKIFSPNRQKIFFRNKQSFVFFFYFQKKIKIVKLIYYSLSHVKRVLSVFPLTFPKFFWKVCRHFRRNVLFLFFCRWETENCFWF